MPSFLRYLFFCFFCLSAFGDNLLSGKKPGAQSSIVKATLFFVLCGYFLFAGLFGFGLRIFQIEIQESLWLKIAIGATFFAALGLGLMYFLSDQRAARWLTPFAPLMSQNRWVYPLTALLVFALAFVVFLTGMKHLANN